MLLPTPQLDGDAEDPENYRGVIVGHARSMAEQSESGSELAGFVVIGMYSDGRSSLGWRMPDNIPSCLAPAYVAELIRRDIVTGREAEYVFDNKFEWVEG